MRRRADPLGYSSGYFVGDVGNRGVCWVAMRAAPAYPGCAPTARGTLSAGLGTGRFCPHDPGEPGHTLGAAGRRGGQGLRGHLVGGPGGAGAFKVWHAVGGAPGLVSVWLHPDHAHQLATLAQACATRCTMAP